MIPFVVPIVLGCVGVCNLAMPKVMDKKLLKLYREDIKKYEDLIEESERNIRNGNELLEAARNDLDMCKDYSEVDIVIKKQYIRELEESIEALKQHKKKTEERKKECEEAAAKLETKLY